MKFCSDNFLKILNIRFPGALDGSPNTRSMTYEYEVSLGWKRILVDAVWNSISEYLLHSIFKYSTIACIIRPIGSSLSGSTSKESPHGVQRERRSLRAPVHSSLRGCRVCRRNRGIHGLGIPERIPF